MFLRPFRRIFYRTFHRVSHRTFDRVSHRTFDRVSHRTFHLTGRLLETRVKDSIDFPLSEGEYYFRLCASNIAGNSEHVYANKPAVPRKVRAPGIIEAPPLGVQCGRDFVRVVWTPPSDAGSMPITGYDLEHSCVRGRATSNRGSVWERSLPEGEVLPPDRLQAKVCRLTPGNGCGLARAGLGKVAGARWPLIKWGAQSCDRHGSMDGHLGVAA